MCICVTEAGLGMGWGGDRASGADGLGPGADVARSWADVVVGEYIFSMRSSTECADGRSFLLPRTCSRVRGAAQVQSCAAQRPTHTTDDMRSAVRSPTVPS
jgi:hypothetical protein